MKIKDVVDCAIVRLADGRVGWKGKNTPSTCYNRILFAERVGVELKPNDEVEVLKWPANLAAEYVESLSPVQQGGEENISLYTREFTLRGNITMGCKDPDLIDVEAKNTLENLGCHDPLVSDLVIAHVDIY